jgi:hypothetical protein
MEKSGIKTTQQQAFLPSVASLDPIPSNPRYAFLSSWLDYCFAVGVAAAFSSGSTVAGLSGLVIASR